MGNQICTDQRPFALDDIRRTKDDFPNRKALDQHSPLILRSTQHAFDSFEHNIKAFSFALPSTTTTSTVTNHHSVNNNASGIARRSNIVCQPVSLRDIIDVDPVCAYMILHIRRTDVRQLLPSSKAPSTASNVVPDWAADSFAAFTPRGLGTPFGIDIAAVRWREKSAADQYRFEYSVHVYNGRASHQLVVAVATMHAFQLEKQLMNDTELLQRLFYGFNAAKASELSLPAAMGTLRYADPRIDLALHRSRGPLHVVLQHHALLRTLYSVSLDISPTTPRLAATSSSSTASTTVAAAAVPTSVPDIKKEAPPVVVPTQQPPAPPTQSSVGGFKLRLPVKTDEPDDTPEPPVNRRSPQKANISTTSPRGGNNNNSAGGGLPPPRLNLSGIKSLSLGGLANGVGPSSEGAPLPSSRRVANEQPPRDLSSTQTFASPPSEQQLSSSTRRSENEEDDEPQEPPQRRRGGGGEEGADEVKDTIDKIRKLKEQSPVATEVLPYLYVGGEEAAKDRAQLVAKGITHVINAAAHSIPCTYTDVFSYTSFYICDSPDEPLLALIPLANRIVEEARLAGGKTFIHCHQGVSRSCSLVIGFVMWKMGICYDEAFSFVKDRRKVCSPNSGFYVNLLRWEKILMAPPAQQCWAYTPFSKEYTFPFIFQAVESSSSSSSLPSSPSSPQKPGITVPPVVLDCRISYALLTPSTDSNENTDGTVYLLKGSECVSTYSQAAYAELENFLKYGFYSGPTAKSSTNSRGATITYTPTTFMRRRIVELSTENPKARGIASMAIPQHPNVVFQINPTLNALLQNDLPQLLEQWLEEQHRVEGQASARKRVREEEVLAPQQHSSSPSSSSPPKGAQSMGGLKSLSLPAKQAWGTGSSISQGAAPSNKTLAEDESNNADENVRRPSSSPSTHLLVDAEDSEPEEGTSSVQVYEYPFDSPEPLDDIIVIDDLITDKGYAIVVRGYRGAGVSAALRKPHKVYLWLGEEFTKDEDTLRSAFLDSTSSDGPLGNVRITNRTRLGDVEGEVVYEREEPSELLLAFA